ncbi:MAG: DUF4396 domain-containing protein [Nocardioidaceae bacterium]
MPATWLIVLAWVGLVVGFASAAVIAYDIYGRRHRQQMSVMEAVWPITALYMGPGALWGYRRFGQPMSPSWRRQRGLTAPPDKPGWAATGVGVSHCGAGCTLGDLIAEVVIFALGASIAGVTVYAEMLGDYLAAVGLGIIFQYFAIAPHARTLPP